MAVHFSKRKLQPRGRGDGRAQHRPLPRRRGEPHHVHAAQHDRAHHASACSTSPRPSIGGDGGAAAAEEADAQAAADGGHRRQGASTSPARAACSGRRRRPADRSGPPTIPLNADGKYDYAALTAQLVEHQEGVPRRDAGDPAARTRRSPTTSSSRPWTPAASIVGAPTARRAQAALLRRLAVGDRVMAEPRQPHRRPRPEVPRRRSRSAMRMICKAIAPQAAQGARGRRRDQGAEHHRDDGHDDHHPGVPPQVVLGVLGDHGLFRRRGAAHLHHPLAPKDTVAVTVTRCKPPNMGTGR